MKSSIIKIALNNHIAGAGKDSIADYLVEKHGFKKYSLSEWIYSVAWNVYGIERGVKPPRKLLHHIGESLREYDKMVWLNKTMRLIEAEGHKKVVITDVRKGLEHFYLKECGFNNVKIVCDKDIAISRMAKRDGTVDTKLVLGSNLETELSAVSMQEIDNSGEWEETVLQIETFLKNLK